MAKTYYRIIRNRTRYDGDEAEILLYDPIGEDTWGDGMGAKQFSRELKALGQVNKLTVRINSPGGSVFEGLTIYNTLRQHPADVTVYVDGIAASIASVIAMAGDKVIMPENSVLMVHDPGALALGTAEDMRKMADILDKTKESLITAYRDKTGLSDEKISELMSAETWMSAKEAVELHFADELAEPVRIAASFDLSKFKNVPTQLMKSRKQNGGSKKMEDKKTIQDDSWKKDLYAERERTTGLIKVGKMFNCGDLAQQYILEGKTEDDLRMALLNKMDSQGKSQPLITVEPRAAARPFDSFGDFLMSVKNAGTPGRQADPRLFYNAGAGQNESVPSESGFLVQSDFTNALLDSTYKDSILAPRCFRLPISGGSNGVQIPMIDERSRVAGSRFGGVQTYWVNEGATVTDKKPKYKLLTLSLKKLMGLSYVTDELLQDSAALEAVTRAAFSSEIAYVIDDRIINGTGAGQPLGIVNSNALVTVDKESGQLAKTILFENIVNMWSRLWAQGEQNAIWVVNRDCIPQLFALTLGTGMSGQPVFMPAGGVSGQPYSTIFGRPVISMEQCPTLGTVGDIMLIDPSQYIIADKGGINAAQSIHVRFIYDEMTFRFTYRVDGQPLWMAPLTPASNSANTLSPFVALATRA